MSWSRNIPLFDGTVWKFDVEGTIYYLGMLFKTRNRENPRFFSNKECIWIIYSMLNTHFSWPFQCLTYPGKNHQGSSLGSVHVPRLLLLLHASLRDPFFEHLHCASAHSPSSYHSLISHVSRARSFLARTSSRLGLVSEHHQLPSSLSLVLGHFCKRLKEIPRHPPIDNSGLGHGLDLDPA